MILALGMTLSDGRREFPGVLYDMVILQNNAARKNEPRDETEDDEE